MNTTSFDLLDAQQKMREISCPKKLFEAWERLSYAYLRQELSRHMLDEMRATVWEQFRLIESRNSLSVLTTPITQVA